MDKRSIEIIRPVLLPTSTISPISKDLSVIKNIPLIIFEKLV